MRIIGGTGKKTTWRLARLTLPGGRLGFHTGTDLTGTNHMSPERAAYRRLGIDVDLADNVVVEASMKPATRGKYGFTLTERDSGHEYRMSEGGMMELLLAAAAGRLTGGDGFVTGYYTFVCRNSTVSIMPWGGRTPRDPLPDAPADAVDLSDFIRSLGQPGQGA